MCNPNCGPQITIRINDYTLEYHFCPANVSVFPGSIYSYLTIGPQGYKIGNI